MGQQQIKKAKSNQFQTMQSAPLLLRTFGSLMNTAKIQRISDQEFILNKGKQYQFLIKTHKPATQLKEYQGFVQIRSQNNSKIFAGRINKMLRQGFGVQYDQKERIFYRGEFSNGVYNGWGQTLKYKGEFKDGKKEGWGNWTDSSNNIDYQGFFKDDRFSGIGYLNVRTSQINQFMIEDKIIDPLEKTTQKFVGQWSYGKMNGNGKLITQHEVYKGAFLEGLYDGQGILNKQGTVKEGKFTKGILVKPK